VRNVHKEADGSKLTLSVYLPRNCFESPNVPSGTGRRTTLAMFTQTRAAYRRADYGLYRALQGISMTREDPWSTQVCGTRRACSLTSTLAIVIILDVIREISSSYVSIMAGHI
jgi:hypothetical protein